MHTESDQILLEQNTRSDLVCSRMVRELREAITSNLLKPGDRVQPERALRDQYAISMTSVRRGMDLLVRQGFLVRRQGSGTFVRKRPVVSPPVRRDTIIFYETIVHPPSHPYFGPLNRGLLSRLADLGWKVRPMVEPGSRSNGSTVGRQPIDSGALIEACTTPGNIAGVILHGPMRVSPRELQDRGCPCVVLGANDDFPFVAYDWQNEIERALTVALRNGARRVWVASVMTESTIAEMARRAIATVCPEEPAEVTCLSIPSSQTYSVVTHNAFERTRLALAAASRLPEAIVIGSDFEAQGVIDALTEAGMQDGGCPDLIALISTESRIHSVLPFTALVSDGYTCGVAMADLLHQHITNPAAAPGFIRLSCSLRGPASPPVPAIT